MQINELHKHRFKGVISALFLCFLVFSTSNAQTVDYTFGGGIGMNSTQYVGDVANELFEGGSGEKGLALHFGYYLTPSFDVVYNFDFARAAAANPNLDRGNPIAGKKFDNRIIGNTFLIRYKFANGYILPEANDFDFFLSSGVSFVQARDRIGGINETFGTIPFSVGVQVMILPEWSFNYQIAYHRTFSDSFDGFYAGQGTAVDSRTHDDYMFQNFSVVYHFGRNRELFYEPDIDKDGVPDRIDKCPQIAGDMGRGGCPDKDGDGISDFEDSCPSVPGAVSARGCPDRDADGVPDLQDACPYVQGSTSSFGCPDADGDRVPDYRDVCPDIPGIGYDNGCPNGTRPAAEAPPPEPKPVTALPDTDQDGIPNVNDKCPDTAGPASNQGCPIIDRSVEDAVKNIVKNIQFETGSDRLAQSSTTSLEELVAILKKFPDTKLKIEGHTDSVGNDAKNLRLSKSRAAAVRDFLAGKGIASNRLQSEGYGEEQPVASNDTKEGRAQNRRVDLKISYEH